MSEFTKPETHSGHDLVTSDIRIVRRVLSPESLALIDAAKATAEAELQNQLSRCVEHIAVDEDTLRQYRPFEIVPYFETYAERQYDAYAQEMLSGFPDVEDYGRLLAMNVTDHISNEICPSSRIQLPELSTAWEDFVRLVKTSAPEEARQLKEEISELKGEWETYLARTYFMYVEKHRLKNQDWADLHAQKSRERLSMLFRLKFGLYLRFFMNWIAFDRALRAHLSSRFLYWRAQALSRAASQGETSSMKRVRGKQTTTICGFHNATVLDWQGLEIEFLSDERIQIRIGEAIETRNYHEFGFSDRRSGKPNLAWQTLRDLAAQGGAIQESRGKSIAKLEKRIQEIRRIFKNTFSLTEDPLPLVDGQYRTRFKISLARSFHT